MFQSSRAPPHKKLIIFDISEKELNYTIQLVKIYLSSATFDEIEKEMKVISSF